MSDASTGQGGQRLGGEPSGAERGYPLRKPGSASSNPSTSARSNAAGFAEIYRQTYDRLLRFCRMRILSDADAEDLVQEAFLSVRRAYPDKAGDEVKALLFTSLRNLTRDYLKSSRVRSRQVTSEISSQGDTLACMRTVSPEQKLIDAETLQQVSAILEAVKPRQKEALLLHRLDRLTHDEIAARLEVSPRTVRNDIAEALAAITKGLARAERRRPGKTG